ncbi:MAG: transposase [Oleiphilus sp.]
MPGIGDIIALTLMLEIQDFERFDCVQQFASYARLVQVKKNRQANKLGRAVYHIRRRQDAFDEAYFWKRLNIQF